MPRANSSGTISFGLVSIPVKVYTAQSSQSVKFKQLTPDGNGTKQKIVDAVSGDEVSRGDLLKGFEVAKGQYVTFTKDELTSLASNDTSKAIGIVEFVDAETVEPISVEKASYLGPDKGGDKAYSMLANAMLAKNVVAVAQWTSRGKENLVTIRPITDLSLSGNGMVCLVLQTMLYEDEVRPFDEIGVAGESASEAEAGMAGQLIDALYSEDGFDASQYEDSYSKAVTDAAAEKADGKEITVPVTEATPLVVDLAEALKMSLAKPKAKKAKAKAKPKAKATKPRAKKTAAKKATKKTAAKKGA